MLNKETFQTQCSGGKERGMCLVIDGAANDVGKSAYQPQSNK